MRYSPPQPERQPRLSSHKVGKYTFDSDFDSGNCARVEEGNGEDEFNIFTAADCAGTAFASEMRTWFHFAVRGGEQGGWITITVNNMNCQNGLYKQDYRPLYKNAGSGEWQRIKTPVVARGTKEEENFCITFRHRFDCAPGEAVYFAFCYSWSYAEGQALLDELEARFGARCPQAAGAPDTLAAGAGDIYFRRELLTRSLEGRRVDLITITSARHGLGSEREEQMPSADGLLEGGSLRPHAFADRPVFFISARLHPGETPASHVLNGFLAFALRQNDPRARALRENFVLKIVPSLNPDGVFHGHYRLDTRGVNLNRCYAAPDAAAHPAIFAVRCQIEQLHRRGVLEFHVDLHGHASKRGCFLFGNSLPGPEQLECVLYARLVSLNSQALDFSGCVFTQSNMSRADRRDGQSKEGASRVALYRLTGLTHCYTLECNYNMGRAVNVLHEPLTGRALSPPPIPLGAVAPKYTPAVWAEVGRALACAALDLKGANPLSRLASSGTASGGKAPRVEQVRSWCATHVRSMARHRFARLVPDDAEAGGGAQPGARGRPGPGSRVSTPAPLKVDRRVQRAGSSSAVLVHAAAVPSSPVPPSSSRGSERGSLRPRMGSLKLAAVDARAAQSSWSSSMGKAGRVTAQPPLKAVPPSLVPRRAGQCHARANSFSAGFAIPLSANSVARI